MIMVTDDMVTVKIRVAGLLKLQIITQINTQHHRNNITIIAVLTYVSKVLFVWQQCHEP